jgi:hypothetical protein
MLNTASIGFQANYAVQNPSKNQLLMFDVAEVLFTVIFTSELFLRILSEGRTFVSRKNPNFQWNVFDAVVVGSALLENLASAVAVATPNVSALRMLRTLRLMRIFRVIRVMRFFRDLRLMIAGIVTSLKPLLWACLLLLVIMYMYGVLILMVVGDELRTRVDSPADTNHDADIDAILMYFGDLVTAVWTLFQAILRGMDWGDAADALSSLSWAVGYSFGVYVAFSILCVLNIITGIFIDNVTKTAQSDADTVWMEENENREKVNKEIEDLFESADTDKNGYVDFTEFCLHLSKWEMQAALQRMGVPIGTETAGGLFTLLDFDGNGMIKVEDFSTILPQLHGQARAIDMAKLKHDTKKMGQRLNDLCEICERNFKILY